MKFMDFFRSREKERLKNEVIFLQNKLDNFIYENAFLTKPQIPNVITKEETLEKLLNSNASLARFGDGEFSIILNKGNPHFQSSNKTLANRLREILISNNENILIGIPNVFASLSMYAIKTQNFWRSFLLKKRDSIYSILDLNKNYVDALLTRPYMDSFNREECFKYFSDMKNIWNNKNITIIEGEAYRLGVGNDLFENAKSISRILCPAENAFDKYDEILIEAQKEDKSKLFILALGPTATVLAYDLAQLGYRALDIGHLDIEYEWFLNNARKKTVIKNKYVNEKKKGRVIAKCNDEKHQQQINVRIK